MALDRGSTGANIGARDPLVGGDRSLVRNALRVRQTGIAFGSPVPNIRHRFGGHLRFVRKRDPVTVRRGSSQTHHHHRNGGAGESWPKATKSPTRFRAGFPPGGYDR